MLSYVKNKNHDSKIIEGNNGEKLQIVDNCDSYEALLDILRCIYLKLLEEVPKETFNREGRIEAKLMRHIHGVFSVLKYEMKDRY